MMKAAIWCAPYTVKVERVPDPKILNRRDAIVRMTSTCICGSDLHLVDGYVPTMRKGDVLGHEFMGEVVETGKGVKNLKAGDRVVVEGFQKFAAGDKVRPQLLTEADASADFVTRARPATQAQR